MNWSRARLVDNWIYAIQNKLLLLLLLLVTLWFNWFVIMDFYIQWGVYHLVILYFPNILPVFKIACCHKNKRSAVLTFTFLYLLYIMYITFRYKYFILGAHPSWFCQFVFQCLCLFISKMNIVKYSIVMMILISSTPRHLNICTFDLLTIL